jgi:hypothetical protein
MEQVPNRKRQVPLWVPASIFAVILAGLMFLGFLNPIWLQLVLVFPMGLTMLFAGAFPLKNTPALAVPLMMAPYCLYVVLLVAMFGARKWLTFGVICFILAGVVLLNLAGCRQITAGLSGIH